MTEKKPIPTHREAVMEADAEIRKWLALAGPGDQVIYHQGPDLLNGTTVRARLVEPGGQYHEGIFYQKLPFAAAMWRLYELGKVLLVQRRTSAGPSCFDYIAIKTQRA